jgi:NADH-quinone oxidoreductase subunit N
VGVEFPAIAWSAVLPMGIITAAGLLVLVLDPLVARERQDGLVFLALVGVVAAAQAAFVVQTPVEAFGGAVILDAFGRYVSLLVLLVAGLTLLISVPSARRAAIGIGAYCALLLFATLGMMIMACSADLMTIFLGLETLSISLYILAGFLRADLKSNESALKYLLLGAFASGFFLYGIALVYGATGSIRLRAVADAVAAGKLMHPALLAVGMALLIIGFAFKVAAVPFHMWAPDVYEGAPTPVAAYMIAGTKAAAFAAFLRVLFVGLPGLRADWSQVLWVLAILTMTAGNVIAIAQSNFKRMLAYSSIAHAGYVMVGLVVAGRQGGGGVLFYLAAYALMNLGAFAVILALTRKGEERTGIDELGGLGLRRPLLGAAMALFMFSLIGVPPTGGFMGKLYLFGAAVQAGYVGLAVIGVLNSVVSAFYYLRVTVIMYMAPAGEATDLMPVPLPLGVAMAVAAAGTLALGVIPAYVLEAAFASMEGLLR